jgi:hypothetical protein
MNHHSTRRALTVALNALALCAIAAAPASAQLCDQPLKVSFLTVTSGFPTGVFNVVDPNSCG